MREWLRLLSFASYLNDNVIVCFCENNMFTQHESKKKKGKKTCNCTLFIPKPNEGGTRLRTEEKKKRNSFDDDNENNRVQCDQNCTLFSSNAISCFAHDIARSPNKC